MTTLAESNKRSGEGIEVLANVPLSGKLIFLVLVALIPRIIVFLQPQIITNDGVLYVKMAKLFAEGKYDGSPGSYFNLYPFLIFLVQKVIGDWELSGQLISLVLGTLTVIPVFLLGRGLYDERIGWLAAIFYITLPNLLKYGAQVIRDPTLWFFVVITMWLIWEGGKKKWFLPFALASISAGLGALTRVEGFVVWAALAFYILFRKKASIPVKRKILNLSLFVLIFPVLVSPLFLTLKKSPNSAAIGEMTSFSLTFLKAHARTVLGPQDPVDALGEKAYSALPAISQDALEFASRHRILLAISEVIYKFIKSANLLIILVLLGLWKRKKEGFASSDKFLFYTFAILFLMSVFYARQLYYFSTRHGLTLVLPCIFLAGHGLDASASILSRWLERLRLRVPLLLRYLYYSLGVIFIFLFLGQGLSGKAGEKNALKEVGTWLKQNGYQGSVIMGPKRFLRIAFYADAKFVEMPDSWEKVAQSIQKDSVRAVVIDSCTIREECPGFLENWSAAALVHLKNIQKKEEKCAIQIYGGP